MLGIHQYWQLEMNFKRKLANQHLNDISSSDKQNISVITGLEEVFKKKSTNLPYYAFLKKRERAREEERERRKREPLFSCSPRYSLVYTCVCVCVHV